MLRTLTYVAEPLTLVLLVGLGFFLGNIFVMLAGKMETIKVFAMSRGLFDNLYAFLMGSIYFATMFSVPMSGNVPLFILVAGIFLYTLYGRFAAEKLKPMKPEDKVVSKWFSGHP